ncbi:maleylpyruvate isomerase N-terminal domain-containing protein [Amycolatopsis sp. FDAARGOS 1241]|uniref:maleylpyruvate isomerase N-terminal domain-containing protein n=1 Tax=Amycolatopsis sp. FDAARGOS 1241 TaxID=2778070 RepID=UPI00194E315E|nr:maleylpyruvate isomerase N-terminal domain-containing protein [Amycolatopsis sp. FDAARGOS 1241]QRP44126.1 maleylpyruvate isomerase family mycothiol-dependent enzyme [Amycolatopsis sp. FDAARGOS 1241]
MSRELGPVDHGRLLEALEIEARVLGEVAHTASAEAPVPTAPGWTVRELVRHVGSVYGVTLGWLREGRKPAQWQRGPRQDETVADHYAVARDAVIAELAAHDPADHAATWWPADPTYGFWRRRTLHETLVHRVDAERAAGTAHPAVPADLATDGVDEVLTLYFGHRLAVMGLAGTRLGTVGVQTGGHSWIARAGPDRMEAWRCSPEEAEAADELVSGEPANVYLWLWGRAAPTAVISTGGHDLAAQLWALLRLATR